MTEQAPNSIDLAILQGDERSARLAANRLLAYRTYFAAVLPEMARKHDIKAALHLAQQYAVGAVATEEQYALDMNDRLEKINAGIERWANEEAPPHRTDPDYAGPKKDG